MLLAGLTLALILPQTALKSEDVKVGTGAAVKYMDVIEVHYKGTLMDGKEFDSSAKANKPLRFQIGIGRVIKGWDQGILGMKIGGERNLVIPPDLAYGESGSGDVIPPNSTLKFNVKLVRILPWVQVKVLKEGKGDAIKLGQFLDCKLSLKLPDGKVLNDPSEPAKLQLGPGMGAWLNQSIFGIKVGEKRTVHVGYEMAFGEKGVPPEDQGDKKAGSVVPPKSDITVEVEALKIS